MTSQSTLKRHAGLVDRMAQKLGVDLQGAAIGKKLSLDEISDAVLRCTGCSDPNGCDAWLMRPSPVVAHAPGYCRNAALLERLRRETVSA